MFEFEGQKTNAEQASDFLPSSPAVRGRATNSQIEGQVEGAEQASDSMPLPRVRKRCADQSSGEGQLRVAKKARASIPTPLDTIIAELAILQRQRRFAIKSISRVDRSCEAYLATMAGYRPKVAPDGTRILDADGKPVQDKEGKKLWAEVKRVRLLIEKSGQPEREGRLADAEQATIPLPTLPPRADIEFILASAASREPWQNMRDNVEKRMEALAKQLPVYPWWAAIRGAGPKGLAIIVGEAGDIGAYRDKSALWKRFGMAVIDGERQRRVAGDAGILHAFSPTRRAEIWTIADSLFRAQWRGADEETGREAGPLGPYGEKYAYRRAATKDRADWTPARQNADARRYMAKALLRDLRGAWLEASGRH